MINFQDLQNGRFYWADCFDAMKEIPDGVVDMILCDLPYGTTACAWDSVLPFEQLWKEYWRIAKTNAAIVLTASQPFTSSLVMSQPKNFKYEWIWQKNAGSNFATVKYQPMKEHESVLIFAKEKATYNPIMQERAASGLARSKHKVKMDSTGSGKGDVYNIQGSVTKEIGELRYPSSVQKINRERGLHPTQKPVALFEYLIKTYTNENELVLDNTAGSGTTAIAAINTNRKWICIEKDETYANKAIERIRNHANR